MRIHLIAVAFLALTAIGRFLNAEGVLYIQNDTAKTIGISLNSSAGIPHRINPGSGTFITTTFTTSLYAKYLDSSVSRKLSVGTSIEAIKEGISSVLHIVPGTLYGVKVGYIEKGYDLPIPGRMKIQKMLGVSLQNVEVPVLNKHIAAKILGINISSTAQEAHQGYLKKLGLSRELKDSAEKNYLKYLLDKALSVFKS